MKKKVLSILLAICLVVGMLPAQVIFATEADGLDENAGLCPHHQEHTATCGYAPATETGTLCSHTHDGTCGYTVIEAGSPCWHELYYCNTECLIWNCTHICDDCDGSNFNCPTCGGKYYLHDATCGYGTYIESDDICLHECDESCYRRECTHTEHTEECFYKDEVGEGCTHTHDAACGYAEPSEAKPCEYDCKLCELEEMIDALPDPEDVNQENKDAVQAQLDAIDDILSENDMEWEDLDDDDTVNVQKVVDVKDALDALDETQTPEPPQTEYKVTVVPGEHMTKTAESGAAEQTGLSGAMTDVVFTADEGYIFPEEYAVESVNGITVTRDSETQITVSGTPTADTAITLAAPSEDSDEHSHCICGKTHRAIGGHSAESAQTWQPLTITSGTLSSGSYYLEDNVTITGTISISGTVNLCLNGKTLNGNGSSIILNVGSGAGLNIADCGTTGTISGAAGGGDDAGAIYANGGNVTMFGGSVENNHARNYGNIYLNGGAVFTLNGGSIRNNTNTIESGTYGGGGIYVRTATFVMNGGVISGNSTNANGGGIYCSSYATVYINGGTISGNTSTTKGDGIFYSSLQGNDGKLYIGGAPSIADEIYLDNTSGTKYPYITSAIRNQLNLVVASFAEGRVVAEGIGYTLTKTDLTRITLKDASGNTYYCKLTDNNQIVMTVTDPGYEADKHLVIYDGNGGEGNTADSNEYAVGATATIKENSFTLAGHGFTGWNTAADGSGTAYAPGAEVEITADLILYAQWEEGEYTATFEVEGGTAPANQVVSYEDKLTKPEDPTVEGRNFLGWLYKFESDSDWSSEYWDFENDVVTENVTLKADLKAKAAEGALEFNYAYDVYRSPSYPIKDRDFTIYNFREPLAANGSSRVENAGKWVLTPVGLYADFKNTAANSSYTADIVSDTAYAYGVAADSLIVYKLTNDGVHYAYGTIVMNDPEAGMTLFIGDNYRGGAGYLFSKKAVTEASITFKPESDATDQVGGYNITVAATTNGSASVSQAKAPEGTQITITATPASGYELESISVKDASGANVAVSNNQFTMPASDVTVTVTFKQSYIMPVYTVTIPESVDVDFNALITELGKIIVSITKLDPADWIRVEMEADGKLENSENADNVIPYEVKVDNGNFTSASFEQSGEIELSIHIAQADWDKAYSGTYSDTLNFKISCVAKNN